MWFELGFLICKAADVQAQYAPRTAHITPHMSSQAQGITGAA
jgi:hypothetical protein